MKSKYTGELKVLMIGTIHFDLKGPDRLKNALESVEPDIITIEWPKNVDPVDPILSDIKKGYIEQINHLRLPRSLENFLVKIINISGYEIIATIEYAKKHDIPVHFIDVDMNSTPKVYDNNFAKQLINGFVENLSEGATLDTFLREIDRTSIEEMFQNFQGVVDTAYTSPEKVPDFLLPKGIYCSCRCLEEREKYMANEISKVLEENPGKDVVHIGGAMHTFPKFWEIIKERLGCDGKNLAEMLTEKGVEVTAYKLIEFEKQ